MANVLVSVVICLVCLGLAREVISFLCNVIIRRQEKELDEIIKEARKSESAKQGNIKKEGEA